MRHACQFCSSRSGLVPCAWPVTKSQYVAESSLVVGDILHAAWAGFRSPVLAVSRFRSTRFARGEPYGLEHDITMVGLQRGGASAKELAAPVHVLAYVAGPCQVIVERPAPCDALCCDLHRRDVGDAVAYCMAHWRAWETEPGPRILAEYYSRRIPAELGLSVNDSASA